MISIGRSDLVRQKPVAKKRSTTIKNEQGLGCSDNSNDHLKIKSTTSLCENNSSINKPQGIEELKSEEYQSTGDRNNSKQTEPNNPSENKSKNFLTKLKQFFKLQFQVDYITCYLHLC